MGSKSGAALLGRLFLDFPCENQSPKCNSVECRVGQQGPGDVTLASDRLGMICFNMSSGLDLKEGTTHPVCFRMMS